MNTGAAVESSHLVVRLISALGTDDVGNDAGEGMGIVLLLLAFALASLTASRSGSGGLRERLRGGVEVPCFSGLFIANLIACPGAWKEKDAISCMSHLSDQ